MTPLDAPAGEVALIHWRENGAARMAQWQSEAGLAPPQRVRVTDDRIKADSAYRLACEGTALLWRGDFQNARALLAAMARRWDAKPRKRGATPAADFHLHRMAQAQRARALGMLLIPFEADHGIALKRAPDVRLACGEARGPVGSRYVASLRELLGQIGSHEWRKAGVEIDELGARVHPHYGVFSPIRGEYVTLVARAPLPSGTLAFDIGTGTGVLAAVLARRGLKRVIATDNDPRALACARENIGHLGFSERVEVMEADLFPAGRAPLIVCNPPWLPGKPASTLERAIYDPDSRMLKAYLAGLVAHLAPGGEGWLILSDLAEHLGLRTRAQLEHWFERAGLVVIGRLDAKPRHPKASDPNDPLFAARRAEVTSLWRLAVRA